MKRRMMMLAAAVWLGAWSAGAAEAEKKADAKPYPMDTCVVSGEKLGNHGDPYILEYEGREIRFCCKGCKKDFLKDPATYLKKLDEAEAKAKAAAAPATDPKAAAPAPDAKK